MDIDCSCKSGVIKSETLPECPSQLFPPTGCHGPLVGKIPVVIAEPVVQIDVESVIQLEEPALEIKRIKKNLFITQCKLIDTSCKYEKAGKLFLSGFVRKNIEYATVDCTSTHADGVSGKIRHTTVNVPFTCVTKVKFENPPQVNEKTFAKEFASFAVKTKGHDCCDFDIIGDDICEQNFQHFESFNEKIFCELEESTIFESDIVKDPKPLLCKHGREHIFDKIIEKMVIYVKIKLLQNQQVNIPGRPFPPEDKHKRTD